MLHSLLLAQVLKVSRVWPGFLAFARWWGPEYCRPEDKQPYRADDGRLLPSLEMRLFHAIDREVSHRADALPIDLLAWAENQLHVGLKLAPDDPWLRYYKSKLLLDKGRRAEARDWFIPVVRRHERASWVRDFLGRTFGPDDVDKAITCYFRAVQTAKRPQELARTRIALARLLAAEKRFEEATIQVRKALEYRSQNNFSIPQPLLQMARASWFRSRASRTDLPSEPDVSDAADAIAFGDQLRRLSYRLGVIDNQNVQRSLAHVAFSVDEGIILQYTRFKGISEMKVGDLVEVALEDDGQRAVRWRKSTANGIPGFCQQFSGELTQRQGQLFGFIVTDDKYRIFVHPNLIRQAAIVPGTRVVCRAKMSKDKNGTTGWQALTMGVSS